ncbi:Mitotic checkpoint protein BUB3 [Tupaia chinensis]|uniref:Mitotic checkpoint protein BUB3 n=1 Tax=Tupaia chinensis TaxID=246437 RepID=L9KXV0_TUPCH|nr:Mitotic checkpoint protein BUB3 [Tupaia chinensis]
MTGSNEFKLNQLPEDGISSVKFHLNTFQSLLVSSWDTSVQLYDVLANSMQLKYQHTGAVLDCVFYDATHARSGGLDHQPKMHDLNTDQENLVRTHDALSDVLNTVQKLTNMGYVQQRRESSLKYQTRCIRAFPNKQGYVLSSIEGQVAVEY